jgi:hypothetical protein
MYLSIGLPNLLYPSASLEYWSPTIVQPCHIACTVCKKTCSALREVIASQSYSWIPPHSPPTLMQAPCVERCWRKTTLTSAVANFSSTVTGNNLSYGNRLFWFALFPPPASESEPSTSDRPLTMARRQIASRCPNFHFIMLPPGRCARKGFGDGSESKKNASPSRKTPF